MESIIENSIKNNINKDNINKDNNNLTFEELQKLENIIKFNLLQKYGISDDEMSLSESDDTLDTSDSEYLPPKHSVKKYVNNEEEDDESNESSEESDDSSSSSSAEKRKSKKNKKSFNNKKNKNNDKISDKNRNINDILKIENLKHYNNSLEKKIHFMQLELLNKTNELNEVQNQLNEIKNISEQEEKLTAFLLQYKNIFNKNLGGFKEICDPENENKNKILSDGIQLQNALFKLNQIHDNIHNVKNLVLTDAKFNFLINHYKEIVTSYDEDISGKRKVELFETLYKQIIRRFNELNKDIDNKVNQYNFILQKNFKTKYDFIILFVATLFVVIAIYFGK